VILKALFYLIITFEFIILQIHIENFSHFCDILNKQIRNKFLFVNTCRLFKFLISKNLPKVQIKYVYREKIKFVWNIPNVVRTHARNARWTNLQGKPWRFVLKLYAPCWNFWRGLYLPTEIVGWQIAYSNIHVKASRPRIYARQCVSSYPSSESWSWHGLCATIYFAMLLISSTIRDAAPLSIYPHVIISFKPSLSPILRFLTSFWRIHWKMRGESSIRLFALHIGGQKVAGKRRAHAHSMRKITRCKRGFAWQLIILFCATFYSRVGETCRCHSRLMFFCGRRNTTAILNA